MIVPRKLLFCYTAENSHYLTAKIISKEFSSELSSKSTYEFEKRNISSIQENISSIQNYQGLSFLLVTFTGLADLFP